MEEGIHKTGPRRRIAITGPESTGKSLLGEQLAMHYSTSCVPEYSRIYLEKLGRPYEFEDILSIARGQLALEELIAKNTRGFLFCDTEFLVTRIWSLYKYQKCSPWIDRQIRDHRYDLFLLCDVDLPWQSDPLREHPTKRRELFELYEMELKLRKLPFEIVSGSGPSRLENAVKIIDDRFPA